MCPLNTGEPVSAENAVEALRAFRPVLKERALIGLVEPLGFPISSLRTKKEAISAIEAVDGRDVYKVVHDTFHHHLAGETKFFPKWTGLVHISGVSDPRVAVADMLDAHRILIDETDRLENLAQIRALLAAGYKGQFSFEPFAGEVHALPDPMAAAMESMDFVQKSLRASANRAPGPARPEPM
jgi:2-keto-myo-inositol isomerase